MKSTLYFNGNIITIDEKTPSAECVLVKDGIIEFVGTKEEALKLCDENTEKKDLDGKTLLPGFLDSHGHFLDYVPLFGNCTLAPPPVGDVLTKEDMKNKVKKHISDNNIPIGSVVLALGYDNAGFENQAHPTKFDLDEISTEHAIIVSHASGHMGCANTLALIKMGLDENTEDPQGGIFGRVGDTKELDGFMEETAFLPSVMPVIPAPKPEEIMKKLLSLQDFYASFGITTCQDGMSTANSLKIINGAQDAGLLKLDYVLFPGVESAKESDMGVKVSNNTNYNGKNFRIGGVKLFLDGSPQGRTAWLTEPYLPNGEQGEDYVAYQIFNDEQVYDYMKLAISNKWQLLTHVNGDRAVDQLQDIYTKVKEDLNSSDDLRPVAIHSQIIRDEQIDRYKEIGMMPSYFVDHVYFYGDIHRVNLGDARASRISPVKSTINKDIKYTFHQDTPVLPPNMMLTVHNAVNRVTRKGVMLGASQRITPYEALKGITINAAYQYFEEDTKGSITVGKKADLVILDKNPLEVEPMTIKDITVLETIKDDNIVYKK
ncbi:amidohydrolase [Clostridium sp.]|uniref:amidohydrolase n=1 Tax=Clostridium sp. TaxID=1506 RepID=UPI003F3A4EB5